MPQKLFHVYLDETGDRSLSPRSSPVFAVSAVIIPATHLRAAHSMLDGLNADLGKPTGFPLHWSRNIRDHQHRKHVAMTLARAHIGVMNTLVVKNALGTNTRLHDSTTMYNYAIRRLLERVSWFIAHRGGVGKLTFAHVKNFPYDKLTSYLELLKTRETTIRWRALPGRPALDQPNRVRGLQIADCTAGILSAAVHPDRHGRYEAGYLHDLIPRLYKKRGSAVTSYGMNVIGDEGCMNAFPWWADFAAACS